MHKSGYIAILGAPNAGKSTLLNKILGEKIAIVSSKPQATRKRLKGIYSTDDVQMIFLDTPGIHESTKKLNETMFDEIAEAIRDADVICLLLAYDQPYEEILTQIIAKCDSFIRKSAFLIVINKMDLPKKKFAIDEVKSKTFGLHILEISSETGEGIPDLLDTVSHMLPEGPKFYPDDDLTDVNMREIAAEMIREKVMECMFEEIPYSIAIEIQDFKEQPDQTLITANIIVDQDSQKGMVIGKGGAMIKQIGTLARKELIKILGTKVRLELFVKVDKNWTKKDERLKYYGYGKIKDRKD